MPKIKANNIHLFYEECGQGSSAPIILISGFSADHLAWTPILHALAKKHRVIVFDNRGVGQSDCPDYPYTVEMMADDVAGLCQALNIASAHFIGNSLGGFITTRLAYKYPNLTKTAIISNSAFNLSNLGFRLLLEGQLELLENNASRVAINKVGIGWCFSENFLKRPHMIELLIKSEQANKYPMSAQGFKNQMHTLDTLDANTWAAKITRPCLVISSDADLIFPEKQVREFSEAIPNAKYFCFQGGIGHAPFIEEPKLFSQVVLEFIASKG